MATTPAEFALEGIRLVATLLFAYVGVIVAKREVEPRARLAQNGFALWWFGLAFIGAFSMSLTLGFNAANYGLVVWNIVVYVFLIAIFAALAGLLYYLVYLYTGSVGAIRWVVLYHVLLLLMSVYLINGGTQEIIINDDGEKEVEITDTAPIVNLLFSLGLVLPPLIGAVAYFGLFFSLEDREQRYRVAMVSGSLAAWFFYSVVSSVMQFVRDTEPGYAAAVAGQFVGLAAAVVVLMAFRPPAWIKRRLVGS